MFGLFEFGKTKQRNRHTEMTDIIYGSVRDFKCAREGSEWIRRFSVIDSQNVVYKCRTALYLPLINSDILVFNALDTITSKQVNNVLHIPYVSMNFEDHFISNYLAPSLKKYPAQISGIYELLSNKARSTDAYLITNYIEDLIRAKDNGTMPLFEVDQLAFEAMLSWFRSNVCIRRLKLLGLKLDQIRDVVSSLDYKTYEIEERVRTNPYILYPAGFEACNAICQILRYQPTSSQVLSGKAISDLWQFVKDKGWTCMSSEFVPDIIKEHKDYFEAEYGLTWIGNFVYFPITNRIENETANWFRERTTSSKGIVDLECLKAQLDGSILSDSQKEALIDACSTQVSIMSGEAGTGKTTVISALISALINLGIRYHVCSFTGKAVQRAMQVVAQYNNSGSGGDDDDDENSNFTTIHRLLAKGAGGIEFLIIDEISMVAMPLFHALITRLPKTTQVLMVGDPNQLNPIDWGHLLNVIIHSSALKHVKLSVNYRQGDDGNGLLTNVRNILNSKQIENNDRFQMIYLKNDAITAEVCNIMRYIRQNMPNDNVMIVCPYTYHLKEINEQIRAIVNPNAEMVVDQWGTKFCMNDRVMLTENDGGLIFNGDEGTIVSMTHQGTRSNVIVKWDRTGTTTSFSCNSESSYEEISLSIFGGASSRTNKCTKMLQIAYGITCHKSQGSEWDGIIFAVPYHKRNPEFLSKRMIYTAITRAKKYCYIVGDLSAFKRAVSMSASHTSTLLPYLIDKN